MYGVGVLRRSASRPALALVCGAVFTASTGMVAVNATGASAQAAPAATSRNALDRALHSLVREPDGPPGIAVVVQRGGHRALHRAGAANLADGSPFRWGDSMRLASVAKAFSGATAARRSSSRPP